MRILDNRWVGRAGNVSFLGGILWAAGKIAAGNPLNAGIFVLLALGVGLMGAPYVRPGGSWIAEKRSRGGPRLAFGEPIVGPLQSLTVPLGRHAQPLGSGRVIRVPVVNAQGSDDAEAVHAALTFSGAKGFRLVQPGRWRDSRDAEVTIPGKGRAYELDLYVQLSDSLGQQCYVWNNESLAAGVRRDQFRIEPFSFSVQVAVRGKQTTATADKTWRVMAAAMPQIVPEGEKLPVELAIEKARADEESRPPQDKLADLWKEGDELRAECQTPPPDAPAALKASWRLSGGTPADQKAREAQARTWDEKVSELLWGADGLKSLAPGWSQGPAPPKEVEAPDQSFTNPERVAAFYSQKLAILHSMIEKLNA